MAIMFVLHFCVKAFLARSISYFQIKRLLLSWGLAWNNAKCNMQNEKRKTNLINIIEYPSLMAIIDYYKKVW